MPAEQLACLDRSLGSESGWPRPKSDWSKEGLVRLLPVPWVSSDSIAKQGQWARFDMGKMTLAMQEQALCTVCGACLEDVRVFAVLSENNDQPEPRYTTSGAGLHPRCALLAATYCPNFKDADRDDIFVCWRGQGPGLTDAGFEDVPVFIQPGAVRVSWKTVQILAKTSRQHGST